MRSLVIAVALLLAACSQTQSVSTIKVGDTALTSKDAWFCATREGTIKALQAAARSDEHGFKAALVQSGGDCMFMPENVALRIIDIEPYSPHLQLVGFRLADSPSGGEMWGSSVVIQASSTPS